MQMFFLQRGEGILYVDVFLLNSIKGILQANVF